MQSTPDAKTVMDAIAALRGRIPGERVLVDGPEYATVTALWNGAIRRRPAVVVRCAEVTDVQAGVRVAREHGLPLSVRGAGHDWAGRALADGGLTLDLTGLRKVRIDAERRRADIGGGATANDLLGAAEPFGLVAASGTIGSVGMVGLTLGGGYGPLAGRAGMAADNLLGAEVVLADGSLVRVDAESEPDLLWALRGGGGNFGVVTSATIRLHEVPSVVAGMIIYPWVQAGQVLGLLRELLPSTPDELTVQTAVGAGPDGAPVVMLLPTWSGDPALAAAEQGPLRALTRLGDPLMAQLEAVSLAGLLAQRDQMFPAGRHVVIRTRSVPELTAPIADVITEYGGALTSPLSALGLHHFHGAATRVPVSDTAFPIREPHLMAEIIAVWPAEDTGGERHRAWARSTSGALAPHALPGGYVNLLGPDEEEQIAHAYGANTTRLLAIKSAVDPDGLFSATPLPGEIAF
ncbi:FAD-binding oxidoreductase [Spongiactinospora gelatinilytica]|uniref:FAD-binding oxidoreductase n=1 Tax=Spongiactinospora gelatinilytica TaxID=2666298 RepID=A0A2W2EXU5_9ACTN|nr:FAD-binding oxidoreductase [Spongiactinospora gelatinilytica]PZG21689.1 FAD-binding oxidoreductase [Spongiactinospora gelatinilytica]